MKGFSRISLRLRLTLLTALVMAAVAVVLTAASIGRAETIMVPDNYNIMVAWPEGTSTAAEGGEVTYLSSTSMTSATVPMREVKLYQQESDGQSAWSQKAAGEADTDTVAAVRIEAVALTGAAQKNFAASSAWMLALVMAAGVLLTWIVAGRALKPVRALADTLEGIDAYNLSTRVPSDGAFDEIRRLTDGFNRMLDKLENAFTRQRTFAANAAHELKTPLAAIQSNIEILDLDDAPTAEDYKETLEVVRRNTDRLIDLVGGLLALNDQSPCQLQTPVDSAELLAAIWCNVQPQAAAKELELTLDNELPVLYGQEPLLFSAIDNLVENAVKYTPPHGHIRVSLSGADGDACITVWNDGPPIAPEQLTQIFEPFYRADGSRSQKTPGQGLGLSLVKAIAQRYAGEVEVHSDALSGTTFTLRLPQRRA